MDVRARKRLIRDWLGSRSPAWGADDGWRSEALAPIARVDFRDTSFRRRRLPHLELAGATYFVTFRVATGRGRPFAFDSRRWRGGNVGLPVAALLAERAILFGLGLQYELDAYVVMPNHVHVLLTPIAPWSLSEIMQGIKGASAHDINRALRRRGPLWQRESFDHLIRGESDWLDKREYIHENPVAAGLVGSPGSYPLSSAATLDAPGRRQALSMLPARSDTPA